MPHSRMCRKATDWVWYYRVRERSILDDIIQSGISSYVGLQLFRQGQARSCPTIEDQDY